MSYKVIERETQALLANGALKRLSTDELLEHQTQLRGRVVVITGGASGLGRAFSVGAARRGAKVVIGDVDVKGLEETLSLIAAARGEACGQRCDVTNWDDQLALFDLAQSRYGRVDIVVPNAGIADTNPAEFSASSEENGLQKPNLKTLDVDVTGVIYTARIGLHHMRQNPVKEGKALILIASYAAFYGSPITLLYATAKHAVLGLGRALRYVTANDGINCITLCPYFIDTPIAAPLKSLISRNPLAKVDDFVSALTYASTAPPSQLSSGTLVFVHPSGVMVGGGRGTRPGPFEMPRL